MSPLVAGRIDVDAPPPATLDLPERVVQFGTGAFLRGFAEWFIDEANRAGRFGGSIVAIASTDSKREARVERAGRTLHAFDPRRRGGRRPAAQSNRRVAQPRAVVGDTVERRPGARARSEHRARDLEHDRSGLDARHRRLAQRRLRRAPFRPSSRDSCTSARRRSTTTPHAGSSCFRVSSSTTTARFSSGSSAGSRLAWRLDARFTDWLGDAVVFCNTLVDRIVPGAPPRAEIERFERVHGYRDGMLTSCESYALFAIEGDDALRARLGFPGEDPRVVVAPDIRPYRERKIRLLNGGHTIVVPVALLAGLATVRDAVRDRRVGGFLRRAMLDEIAPHLDAPGAEAFASDVLQRFDNAYIDHALIDITLHGTTKMRVRVVPSIVAFTIADGAAAGRSGVRVRGLPGVHARRRPRRAQVGRSGGAGRHRGRARARGLAVAHAANRRRIPRPRAARLRRPLALGSGSDLAPRVSSSWSPNTSRGSARTAYFQRSTLNSRSR